jgi:hypothetical protein
VTRVQRYLYYQRALDITKWISTNIYITKRRKIKSSEEAVSPTNRIVLYPAATQGTRSPCRVLHTAVWRNKVPMLALDTRYPSANSECVLDTTRPRHVLSQIVTKCIPRELGPMSMSYRSGARISHVLIGTQKCLDRGGPIDLPPGPSLPKEMTV